MKETEKTAVITEFHFSEDLFPDAYIEYMDIKSDKVKSGLSKTGKSIFKYHKIPFHHCSVGGNGVDYLIYDGIIICSFPLRKKREEIYEFLDKHWDERIIKFVKYIDERRESERKVESPFE